MLQIYKAPPTSQGKWGSAYDKRKDFIYEEVDLPLNDEMKETLSIITTNKEARV